MPITRMVKPIMATIIFFTDLIVGFIEVILILIKLKIQKSKLFAV